MNQPGEPLVSIGVPVYNGEPFIRLTLESLLAQTYGNLEIVISDNGSADGTEKICREYAAKDSRICYYRSDTTVDLYANFRRVLQLSSGDYFMWTAADDTRPPTFVDRCVAALLKNPSAVMAHGPVLVKLSGCDKLVEISNEMDLTSIEPADRVRCFTKHLQHNAVIFAFYSRGALTRASLKSYSFGVDYLLGLQMCFLGPAEYIRSPMLVYRQKREPDPGPLPDLTLELRKVIGLRAPLRRKAWAMLVLGCFHLIRIPGLSWKDKLRAAAAHLYGFALRHRLRLSKEVVFMLFWPASVSSTIYRSAKEYLMLGR